MNEDERSTHFQGYADLLFPELSQLFFTLYARISELRSIEEIDAVEDEIRTLLAQRGFDLVLHTVWNVAPVDLERLFMKEVAAKVPDFTAWPEYGEQ